MELNIQLLSNSVGGIKGVFHAGSYDGDEAVEYAGAGVDTVVWVEANPRILNRLIHKTSKYCKNNYWYNHCLLDVDNQVQTFNISSNGQSSSVLEFGKDHSTLYPTIKYTDKFTVLTKRIDTLVAEQTDFNWNDINMLITDCQGADLKVIKGCGDLLKCPSLKIIKAEVELSEQYKDGTRHEELDEFLKQYGFSFDMYYHDYNGWGDHYWFRH